MSESIHRWAVRRSRSYLRAEARMVSVSARATVIRRIGRAAAVPHPS